MTRQAGKLAVEAIPNVKDLNLELYTRALTRPQDSSSGAFAPSSASSKAALRPIGPAPRQSSVEEQQQLLATRFGKR